MSFDYINYKIQGDKKNTEFFHHYLPKIYDWRESTGLNQLVGHVGALVIQVDCEQAINYIKELYLMTPYRFLVGYANSTHNIYILKNTDDTPLYFILEPMRFDYIDESTRMNSLYPVSAKHPNARYIGEIFHCSDLNETVKIIESHDIRFHTASESVNALFDDSQFKFTVPSLYTCNRFGYTNTSFDDLAALNLGQKFELDDEDKAALEQVDQLFHEVGFEKLLLGVDHMATRVLSSSREYAILELMTCSNYYFWGAYTIESMNSSTNVNRCPTVENDRQSPAKVFTANNTPFFVNAFHGTPMPTEDFVRNLGPRMHHIAHEVKDGDHTSGMKNVDYVVTTMKEQGIPFLAHVVGECTDSPDLKQIFSKRSKYSMLITEYVERCHHFDGFFTKNNVAALTEAAGKDENISEHGHVFD